MSLFIKRWKAKAHCIKNGNEQLKQMKNSSQALTLSIAFSASNSTSQPVPRFVEMLKILQKCHEKHWLT